MSDGRTAPRPRSTPAEPGPPRAEPAPAPRRYSAAELARLLETNAPTPEQVAVIEAPLQPTLVVAGAGSGKTETMAARVVYLVANGLVRPEQVLGLTFTRKAAGELSGRIRKRLAQLAARLPADAPPLPPPGDGTGPTTGGGSPSLAGAAFAAAGADGVDEPGDPTVSTYHAFAARIVSEHGLRQGYEPSARLLTEATTWQFASAAVHAYDGDMDRVDYAPATVSARVLDLAGQLAEHLRTPDELTAWTERLVEIVTALPPGARQRGPLKPELRDLLGVAAGRLQLLPLVEEYEARKRREEALDFADQVSRAARVADAHPEVGRVERTRYRVVLLDEYQDTSHAQLVLLRALFGGGHPVTAVGDPCQSIYAWRGASAGNLTRFPTHFPVAPAPSGGTTGSVRTVGSARAARPSASSAPSKPTASSALSVPGTPAPVLPLTTSWRNGARILGLANALSAPLRDPGPTGGNGGALPVGGTVRELRPAPDRAPGTVTCALLPTVEDEAAWVAQRLTDLWRAAGDTPPSTAVLVRTRAQFDRFAAALQAAGMPVDVVGLGGLLATPEVRDLVATLTVLVDPSAGSALLRLLGGARWRLGPRDLDALGRRARHLARAAAGREAAGSGGAEDAGREDRPIESAEERSIVEALDDLGAPDAYSPTGHARMLRLRDELRSLRARVGQPVPDLVAEVERRIGLDVEVASRGGASQALARAHLDAFADAAAEFSDAAEHPTLSGFLAYLGAADERERGLAPGQVDVASGAVQVLTVHAAKGLEWDVVVVPGLSDRVFPSPSKMSDTWVKNPGVLPFDLRGDADDLPAVVLTGAGDQDGGKAALDRFAAAWKVRAFADERRLAYVAVTRARSTLLCSGAWWDTGSRLRGPSDFLDEVHRHCAAGGGTVDVWSERPDDSDGNPLQAVARTAAWPFDPLGPRRDAVEEAAALVVEMGSAPLSDAERDAGRAWAEEAALLLAERDRGRGRGRVEVALPSHLTVSQLVTLRRDPAELARTLRRPVPSAPAPVARRGTAFHAWLERRFGAEQLLDVDELPGAADSDGLPEPELEELKAAFLASAWADRTPLRTEVPFATVLGGVVVRGRMDAIFARDGVAGRDGDAGYDVVDWKTGAVPTGAAANAAAVQLAAYRLAWASLAGVPVARVGGAFHYVRHNRTVRPVDLLDARGLAALIEAVPPAGA